MNPLNLPNILLLATKSDSPPTPPPPPPAVTTCWLVDEGRSSAEFMSESGEFGDDGSIVCVELAECVLSGLM